MADYIDVSLPAETVEGMAYGHPEEWDRSEIETAASIAYGEYLAGKNPEVIAARMAAAEEFAGEKFPTVTATRATSEEVNATGTPGAVSDHKNQTLPTPKVEDSVVGVGGLAAAASDYLSATTYLVARMDQGAGDGHKQLNQGIRDARQQLSQSLANTKTSNPTPPEGDGSAADLVHEVIRNIESSLNEVDYIENEVGGGIAGLRQAHGVQSTALNQARQDLIVVVGELAANTNTSETK